jgi:hypothetical protein
MDWEVLMEPVTTGGLKRLDQLGWYLILGGAVGHFFLIGVITISFGYSVHLCHSLLDQPTKSHTYISPGKKCRKFNAVSTEEKDIVLP